MTNSDLCVYDRKLDCFSRKKISTAGKRIDNLNIITSFKDSKGYLWLATYSGIFRFKLNRNPLISSNVIEAESYLLKEDDLDKVNINVVFSFIEDENGRVWTTSYSNKLFYYDRQLNSFIPQPINHPDAKSFSNNGKVILKDRDGDIFVTIEHVGLLMWDRKNNKYNLYKPNGKNTGPNGDMLFTIAENKDGMIWIGDRNDGGISIFNKKTGKFSYVQSDESNPYSLNSNKINCIYCDRTGSIWIGTIMGISKYSPNKIKFNRFYANSKRTDQLSFNNVLCFDESKNGNIWIGTDGGGLNKFNRGTGNFTHYLHDPSNPNSISSNAIISVCEDHEGTLWLGTFNGGLGKMKDNKFSAYLTDPTNPYSIAQNHVWDVFEDSKNNLWVATLTYGLELFDRKTNRFYQYLNRAGDSTSICSNGLIQFFEDSKHQFYITSYTGVSSIDLNAIDFSKTPPDIKFKNLLHDENKNSISNNSVFCVAEDKDKNLWFGTMATGMDKLERATGKFTNYSTKDGLPGNSVSSILFDDNNDLWIATDKGLAKFNPKTKSIHIFDSFDGLQNKNFSGRAIQTSDGEMYFSGTEGFNSFYPEKISYNKSLPTVVITDLKIFNQSVKVEEKVNGRIILANNISETSELVLTYRENYFSFEFIALDFTAPEKNNYAYMMEGFDQGWIQCGTKHEANYTNLDPGEYAFRVKASNNDGVWNEEGTVIKVIILPPWWKTWWFRLIVVFSFISILAYIVFARIQHFKKQKVLLERLVAIKIMELQKMNTMLLKQTEELNQTNTILEERQEQIEQQSEELLAQKESVDIMNRELHDLNATKDKFFSIIAHDIKNPFNAILGFSELLIENYKEWPDVQKLEIIDLINSSSKNLYQLLENLLQWSRSQRGIIEFNPEKIELTGILSSVTDIMKGNAEAKNINLSFTITENGLAVHADRQMLNTIVRNLISNALKFTNSGGKVQIIAEKSGEFVNVKVTDNGVGIRNDVKDKLFKIDSNHTTYGTANETGTGLGLILVKEFVDRHGGKIGVDSVVGEGSTFHFTIPLAKS